MALELDRHVEERLGGHGEELGGVGGAVGPQRRAVDALAHRVVGLGAHLDPPLHVVAAVEAGRAVDDVVAHVELVGELVEDHVAAAVRDGGPPPRPRPRPGAAGPGGRGPHRAPAPCRRRRSPTPVRRALRSTAWRSGRR